MTPGSLERQFDDAMMNEMNVYGQALEEGYNATRCLQMLHEHRGLETARILLHATNVSEGYVALWERGRLVTVRSTPPPRQGGSVAQ